MINKENKKIEYKKGFTLLEALVAIAIVLVAISTAFTIIPQGQIAIRHIRNQITATYLAQESLEVVRNHRDKYMLHNYPSYVSDWKGDNISGPLPYTSCITDVNDPFPTQCMVNSYFGTQSSSGDITPQFILCLEDGDNNLFTTNCDRLQYIERTVNGQNIKIYGNNFNTGDGPEDTIFTRWVEIKEIRNEMAGAYEYDATHCDSCPSSGYADESFVQDDVELQVTAHVIWNDHGNRSVTLRENLLNWRAPFSHAP